MTHPAANWPPDNAIVALFRQWVVAEHEAHELGERGADDGAPEHAEFKAACERTDDLADAIAAIASRGPIGLAIKPYLRHYFAHAGRAEVPPATLGEIEVDCGPETDLERSILEDAGRFVPELAPLAAAVVGADTEEEAA